MLIYLRLIEAHLIKSSFRIMALAKLTETKGVGAEGRHGGAELVHGITSSVLSCIIARSAIIIIISLSVNWIFMIADIIGYF